MTEFTSNDKLKEWISLKRATHEQENNEAAIRVLNELEVMIEIESISDEMFWDLVNRWMLEYESRKNGDAEMRAWGMAHDNCADDLREVINDA